MKKFIDDQFLLQSDEASRLYHEYAADLPIIDFHCHLSPDEIESNRSWENISQIWLDGDHYKWRAMRSNGIDERFCTGNATDREEFDAYARHEYFRRVLCNVLGNDMAQGLVPHDFDLVGATIADISYHNANSYFGF